MKFKIGDEVTVIGNRFNGRAVGYVGKITGDKMRSDSIQCYYIDGDTYNAEDELELISNNNKSMNIKEKFVLAITPEPKRSFRKAGITDGDDILTEDGMRVFLTWLLHNIHSADFKKNVVDGILKESKEEKG